MRPFLEGGQRVGGGGSWRTTTVYNGSQSGYPADIWTSLETSALRDGDIPRNENKSSTGENATTPGTRVDGRRATSREKEILSKSGEKLEPEGEAMRLSSGESRGEASQRLDVKKTRQSAEHRLPEHALVAIPSFTNVKRLPRGAKPLGVESSIQHREGWIEVSLTDKVTTLYCRTRLVATDMSSTCYLVRSRFQTEGDDEQWVEWRHRGHLGYREPPAVDGAKPISFEATTYTSPKASLDPSVHISTRHEEFPDEAKLGQPVAHDHASIIRTQAHFRAVTLTCRFSGGHGPTAPLLIRRRRHDLDELAPFSSLRVSKWRLSHCGYG
ncbi:hypothetical protein G7046_g8747 [Stylonectria norvegica]|nr:hypothetical protein G7046_g8747 [Stylonectria norvegica]